MSTVQNTTIGSDTLAPVGRPAEAEPHAGADGMNFAGYRTCPWAAAQRERWAAPEVVVWILGESL
jgi:hypothetical protein